MAENTSLRPSKKSNLVARDLSESLGKLPPQAIDLEEEVLGAILSNRQALLVTMEILKPDDFHKDAHKDIFQAICDVSDAGHAVDLKTVVHRLRSTGKLEMVGGSYVVADLASAVKSSANTEYHCRVIQEKRILRDIIMLASNLHNLAYDDGTDCFELVDKISAFPLGLIDGLKGGAEKHIKEGVIQLAQDINTRKSDAPEIIGIPSGYHAIDKITLGWREGKLIIVAARPGMGKSTFAVNCIRNAAVDFRIPVSLFSLEMTFIELAAMFSAIDSDIEVKHIISRPFTPLDMTRFVNTTAKLSQSPIYIDDTPSLSITALRTKARRHVEKYGTKMIVVDYIQLMKGEQHALKNREQEISSISRGLKLIAMELKIPVMALSQLSRDVEKRGGTKKPILSDLRESGSIEQDADMVMFAWRPSYYKITGDDDGTFLDGVTEMQIAKHRGGKTGEPFLQFVPSKSKFVGIDSPYEHQQSPHAETQQPNSKPNAKAADEIPF